MNKVLYICVDEPELKELYNEKISIHNENCNNNIFVDSGFDIMVPEEYNLNPTTHFVDFKITCAMFESSAEFRLQDYEYPLSFMNNNPKAFYLYPRSSISKTPFRLANNVGIIDSGYRGNLGAYFDVKYENSKMSKHQRLLQICSNDLSPFYVVMIERSDLMNTIRGENGFGSTGQ